MASEVKNGEVVKPIVKGEYVKCDRCGRTFLADYKMCVCRG